MKKNNIKLSIEQVRRLRHLARYMKQRELAAEFKISQSQVSNILKQRQWKDA